MLKDCIKLIIFRGIYEEWGGVKAGNEEFNEDFVKHFLLNDSVVAPAPTESLLIQTDSLKKITEKIQSNKTFCFKTDPGKFGWCGTCKVGLVCRCFIRFISPSVSGKPL